MRAPTRLMPRWSKEQLARLREIERDFHVRAFGEELARVNLDLTIEERHRYIDWMRELARKNGVPPERDPFDLEMRSEEHTSELQSRLHLVCRLLLEKKKKNGLIVEKERREKGTSVPKVEHR